MFWLFFPVIIVCILLKCYFLGFHWIFFSFSFRCVGQPFVHKRTANGRPKYSSTVCAETESKLTSKIFSTVCAKMFGLRCVPKCSSAQIVHRKISRPIHRTANEQQTDSKRTSKIFVNRLTSVIFAVYKYCHFVRKSFTFSSHFF